MDGQTPPTIPEVSLFDDTQWAADHHVGEFAGEQVALVKGDDGCAGLEAGFVGGAGDAFDGAGDVRRRNRLVGEERGFFDDGECEAVAVRGRRGWRRGRNRSYGGWRRR